MYTDQDMDKRKKIIWSGLGYGYIKILCCYLKIVFAVTKTKNKSNESPFCNHWNTPILT